MAGFFTTGNDTEPTWVDGQGPLVESAPPASRFEQPDLPADNPGQAVTAIFGRLFAVAANQLDGLDSQPRHGDDVYGPYATDSRNRAGPLPGRSSNGGGTPPMIFGLPVPQLALVGAIVLAGAWALRKA